MKPQSNFILFFTSETYRWATIELWRVKFCELPPIKSIIVWWQVRRTSKKMRGMTPLERHEQLQRMKWKTKKTSLINSLVRLCIAIFAESEEEFFKCKERALENEYLNSRAELQDSKAWLEQITMDEANYERLLCILGMLEDD